MLIDVKRLSLLESHKNNQMVIYYLPDPSFHPTCRIFCQGFVVLNGQNFAFGRLLLNAQTSSFSIVHREDKTMAYSIIRGFSISNAFCA